MSTLHSLNFDNTFARLDSKLFTHVAPQAIYAPHVVHFNPQVAQLLDLETSNNSDLATYFSGAMPLPNSQPLAMTYSGHQFGQYNPQLGDGRGLLLGEVVNSKGERWDIHLKGAGKTPYSRFGDGRAVLRSSIREYLGSEALHGLGIPSTRALCIIGSKEPVQRETTETAATLVRVADSHIRFGHFEWIFNNQPKLLKSFSDYVIQRHYPSCQHSPKPYANLLQQIVTRTATLMAQWQLVGFAHGVMNTDNFSITGCTFDYGPYGFLDVYNPSFICNHSDNTGRYAWNQQPSIGLWNLNALAYALSPLIDKEDIMTALQSYEATLLDTYYKGIKAKLGLIEDDAQDNALAFDLLDILMKNNMDYTRTFRALSHINQEDIQCSLRDDCLDRAKFDDWFKRYTQRLAQEKTTNLQRQQQMQATNPKYILRNYLAQIAIEKAEKGDFSEIDTLLMLVQNPYDEHPNYEHYANTPPDWGQHLEISCSS
ncbi:MAG: YdiU family protein [Moraxellaceae bacterium]|nr:YdiU family protein [Moraxellaceae bacterium]